LASDRVALVTGGASGLGRASALAFAAAGARVVVADVDADGGAATVAAIESGGAEAIFIPADVTEDSQVGALVAGVVALRQRCRELRQGGIAFAAASECACAYERFDCEGQSLVCLNAGDEPVRLELSLRNIDTQTLIPETWPGWSWEEGTPVMVSGRQSFVDLPARSGRILRAR